MKFCWKSTIFGSLFHSLSSAFLIGLARSFLQLRFNIWYNDISLMKKKKFTCLYIDLALEILKRYPTMAYERDEEEKKTALHVLAQKDITFTFSNGKNIMEGCTTSSTFSKPSPILSVYFGLLFLFLLIITQILDFRFQSLL